MDAVADPALLPFPESSVGNATDVLIQLNELQAENDRLRQIKKTTEDNGLLFYRPHLKQHKFHSCTATFRYGRTGNRFGKSEMGIAEDLAWAIGGRLWYRYQFNILDGERNIVDVHPGGYDHPLVTQGIPRRPVKILILVVDWDMVKKIFTNDEGSYETLGKLFKMCPKENIGRKMLSRGGHMQCITIKRPPEYGGGESSITFDTVESFKHNKLGAESDDWDRIHIDEPCPEAMYKAYARGLMDRNGGADFTCTPLNEMWINDAFCPPGHQIVKDAPAGLAFANRFIITGGIYDNPYRNDQGVKDFESTLTREERECRILGYPLAMAGMVYKEFVYDMHVLADVPKGWKSYDDPPLDYTIRVYWDVHQRIPQALLYFATAPDGTVYVYHEQFSDPLIDPNATQCIKRLADRNVCLLGIDPFAVVPNAVTGESVLDELWKYDLAFDKASKDLTTGVSRVRERLAERNIVSKLPTIFFSPRLTQTLFEFSHYVYDIDKNEPKDKDNHMMENLYRAVLGGLDYVKPSVAGEFSTKPLRIAVNEVYRDASYLPRRSLLRL